MNSESLSESQMKNMLNSENENAENQKIDRTRRGIQRINRVNSATGNYNFSHSNLSQSKQSSNKSFVINQQAPAMNDRSLTS